MFNLEDLKKTEEAIWHELYKGLHKIASWPTPLLRELGVQSEAAQLQLALNEIVQAKTELAKAEAAATHYGKRVKILEDSIFDNHIKIFIAMVEKRKNEKSNHSKKE